MGTLGVSAIIILIIVWYMSSTDDDRRWRNKDFQRNRRVWAERGIEYSGRDLVCRMHKKYGYKFDPWYPEFREKIIETEKASNGDSITEDIELEYNVGGIRKNPIVTYRIAWNGETRSKEIKRQRDAQLIVNLINSKEIEILEVENQKSWDIMRKQAERNLK